MIELGAAMQSIFQANSWSIVPMLFNLILSVMLAFIVCRNLKNTVTLIPVMMILVSTIGIKYNIVLLALFTIIAMTNVISLEFIGSMLETKDKTK